MSASKLECSRRSTVSRQKPLVGPVPTRQPGEKGRRDRRPRRVDAAELAAEKLLLREHDPLVVQPEHEADDDGRPPDPGEERYSEPHQIVAEVDRVAHHRVEAAGVERLGLWRARVAAGGVFGDESHRRHADREPREREEQADGLPREIEAMIAAGVPALSRGDQQHGKEHQRQVSPPPKEPVPRRLELLAQTHRGRPVSRRGR